VRASHPPQGIEHAGVDVLRDVEHAQVVTRSGPHLGQHRGVQVRAVGDDRAGRKPFPGKVFREPARVIPIVRRDPGEGHREVADRIGGDEPGAVAEVHLIDARGAGEVLPRPPAVGGTVERADLPVEAVGQEAIGQLQVEVSPHRFPDAVAAQPSSSRRSRTASRTRSV